MLTESTWQAVDSCYDAVAVPSLWPDALQRLAETLDSAAMMFYPLSLGAAGGDPRNPSRHLDATPTSREYAELIDDYTRNKWYIGHYRAERGIRLFRQGQATVIEHDLASDDERRRLSVYNELYLGYGFTGYAMTGFSAGDSFWAVPMVRRATQGESGHFRQDDKREIEALVPHFRRMIQLSDRFALARAKTCLDVLEDQRCGALLLDWSGRVIAANPAAEASFDDDFGVRAGRLFATDPGSARQLRTFLARLRTAETGVRTTPVGPAAIRRPGKRPLLLEGVVGRGIFRETFSMVGALVTLDDLAAVRLPDAARLVSVLGLTPAEAAVAVRLAGGDSLSDIADAMRLGRETIRSHLKSILAKTDTHRQSELVILLQRLARS